MLVQPDTVLPISTSRQPASERTDSIRGALLERRAELTTEYAEAVNEMTISGIVDSGDDVADLGTKVFAREQEFALSIALRERLDQVERALERLDAGTYGTCDGCHKEIPVARLAAFPMATRCVTCKAAEERR